MPLKRYTVGIDATGFYTRESDTGGYCDSTNVAVLEAQLEQVLALVGERAAENRKLTQELAHARRQIEDRDKQICSLVEQLADQRLRIAEQTVGISDLTKQLVAAKACAEQPRTIGDYINTGPLSRLQRLAKARLDLARELSLCMTPHNLHHDRVAQVIVAAIDTALS